jgi:hypothetical protein
MIVLARTWFSPLLSAILFVVIGPAIGFWFLGLFAITNGAFSKADQLPIGNDLVQLITFLPAAYGLGWIPASATGLFYGTVVSLVPPAIAENWYLRAPIAGLIGAARPCICSDLPL